MTYEEQLNDPRWKAKAKEIKARDNYTCQVCDKTHNLNAHHADYDFGFMAWEYPDHYLLTLCDDCHKFEHECKTAIRDLLVEANLNGMLYMDLHTKMKPILDF